jgi:hypothetical protein
MEFPCSCHHYIRLLYQKQTDIEKEWVSREVTVVSIKEHHILVTLVLREIG